MAVGTPEDEATRLALAGFREGNLLPAARAAGTAPVNALRAS